MKVTPSFIAVLLAFRLAYADSTSTNTAPVTTDTSAPSTSTPQPETWKTTDGKVYEGVTVVKVETDCVSILDSDGGARLPLAKLPPDLQKRFNYDPVKAKQAADARAQQEAAVNKAILVQMDQTAQARAGQQKAEELLASRPKVYLMGGVLQKVPGVGLLVDCEMPVPVVSDSQSIGGGGGVAYVPPDGCPAGVKRIYGTFLVKGLPNEAALVDGDAVKTVAYSSGPFSYTTVLGASKTVAAYTAVAPGN